MPISHLAIGRAMKFGMQNRSLLPERALQFQGYDLRSKIGERAWSKFGDKGLNRMAPGGTLIRQGSEFDLHLAGDVGDSARQGARISEEEHRRAAGFVETIGQLSAAG